MGSWKGSNWVSNKAKAWSILINQTKNTIMVTCKETWTEGETDLDLEREEEDLGGEGKQGGEERERKPKIC